MYVLLNGSKKNAGDFLIFERAYNLIKTYRNTDDLHILPRWLPVDDHLDLINKSDGLFICGGPGYAKDFYPGIYPLVDDLSRIKVPIIPLAVGWSGQPNANVDAFEFTQESKKAIHKIHSQIPNSSVRDVLTEKIVKDTGVDNVLMTGCAAWYYLPLIEHDFVPPRNIQKVIVSTPAKLSNFPLARALVDSVKQMFPHAEKYLVFHRGMFPDQYTNIVHATLNMSLAAYGKLRGYNVINAAYGTEKLEFYQNCDLHIGFRVHGHIDFLSYRRASILVQEDGRGLGQTLSLGSQDVDANDPNAISKIEEIVQTYLDTNFDSVHDTIQIMQNKHQTMKDFIESL